MNVVSTIFSDLIKSITKEDEAVADLALKVKTGHIKQSELDIMARGGHGISRRYKRRAKRAKRRLEKGEV